MLTRTWMAPTCPALMMSAVTLVGCGSGAENAGPPRPRPVVSMTPSDLTSAVGATPLQIAIDNHSAAVGVSLLAPVAAEVGLVSWPEGEPVPVTMELQEFEPRRDNGFDVFGSGKITVAPDAALGDRWYFLYLAGAPADVELSMRSSMRRRFSTTCCRTSIRLVASRPYSSKRSGTRRRSGSSCRAIYSASVGAATRRRDR